MFNKKVLGNALVTISAFVLLLGGCSQQTATETAPPQENQASAPVAEAVKPKNTDQATYLVAVEASYAPYAFRDENGWVIGFDADLLNAIAEHQGFQLKFLHRPWDGIFDTLNSGERDIVASGAAITDERKTKMDFSDPYLKKIRAAIVLDPNIKTFDDLANKKIAVQQGSTESTTLEKYFNNSGHLIPASTVYLAIKDLLASKVDAAFGDAGVTSYYVKNNFSESPLRTIAIPTADQNPEYLGFAIKKGNNDLRQKLNEGLKQVKADGTYDKLYEKWFGSSEVNLKTE